MISRSTDLLITSRDSNLPTPEAGRGVAIVLNPGSGSADNIEDLRKMIAEALPEADLMLSDGPGDVARLAGEAQAKGYDVVVAAGGDGTLNEVLNGCVAAGGKVTLGLLPLGTGNDFARTLGVPFALSEALEVIRDGVRQSCDIVRISGRQTRYMINVAAGGFAGIVNEKLTPEMKAAWGPLSYVRGMVEALGDLQVYEARVRINDGPVMEEKFLNIVVANARHVARGLPIAPTADTDDGQMDLVAIREASLPALALLTPAVLTGMHLDYDEVLHLRAYRIEIDATPPMTFNADGEVIGETPLTFELLPGAISFVAPRAIASGVTVGAE